MAYETHCTSDSDDGYITKIVGDDLEYLKQRLSQCITESKDLTAEIHHLPGQPAQLFFTIGTKSITDFDNPSKSNTKPGTKLLVKNLPDTADEDHLEMFFEHKRQGGSAVKRVMLYKHDNLAIIEFQEAYAVEKVLKKQPIKMLGKTVKVEKYLPYLDADEDLKTIELRGIPKDLCKDIATLKLKKERKSAGHGTYMTQSVKVVKNRTGFDSGDNCSGYGQGDSSRDDDDSDQFGAMFVHPGVECDGCNKRIAGIRYKCRSCRDFDFCSSCKSRRAHHPNHKFQKIPHPMNAVTDPLLQAFSHILK